MTSIDVHGPIRVILRDAERRFDAAIDDLAPPTPQQKIARENPTAVGLAHMVHAWQTGIENFARAFSTTMDELRRQNR